VSIAATATTVIRRPVPEWTSAPATDGDVLPVPRIPYVRLRVTLAARQTARLPATKGSLLRGAFGHALRREVCAMGPRQQCAACPLRDACAYVRLFEPWVGREPRFLAGLPAEPRGYVFEPSDGPRTFLAGAPLDFDLLLLGRMGELQGLAVAACDRMARRGLGVRRARFELERVRVPDPGGGWRTGYERGVRPWSTAVPAALPPADPILAERLTLRFSTPLRCKTGGRLTRSFDFPWLVAKMLRRTLELAHDYAPGQDLDWDLEPWLEKAAAVRVVRCDLVWHDWQRYSNRQRTRMQLGGLVGEMTLEGDLRPFSALLRTAEIVHVGKGTTFGLGKIQMEPSRRSTGAVKQREGDCP
jgi:CRISPR-associated endoribonuclease Cas6